MSRKRRIPDGEDEALWRAVTEDITPLPKRKSPLRKKLEIKLAATPTAVPRRMKPLVLPPVPPPRMVRPKPPLEHGDAPDVDRRTAERLRRGQMPIDMRVDLHGMTREEAHHALSAALASAWGGGRRVILVITGKGQGILRDAVPRWLNEGERRRRILSFCHAQPKDGGSGALYVLLKRKR